MKALQEKYGFDTSQGQLTGKGQRQFRDFEHAMQFQHNRGLLKTDRINKEDFLKSGMEYMQGGEQKQASSGQDAQRTMRLTGTVKVDLEGQKMVFSNVHGSGRGDVAPIA